MNKIKDYLKKNRRQLIISLLISIITMYFWTEYQDEKINKIDKITYNQYLELLEEDKIDGVYYNESSEWMTITLYNDETREMSLEDRIDYKGYTKDDKRLVYFPGTKEFSRTELLKKNIMLKIVAAKSTPLENIFNVITLIFPIFWIIMIFTMLKASLGSTESKKDLIQTSDKKFTDVINHEEIMDDIKFITDLVQHPEKGKDIGATVPKGILLSGPPGNGKTLIAKVIAGEANVPFVCANASKFIDRFVGQGARNVRELFKVAKQVAPCVMFIDEIDAVGDREHNKGTQENDQTINALLQAMDGFTGREGIFIIAATNRPDAIDEALVRSGRFDRQIIVGPPKNWKERKNLFDFYLDKFATTDDIDVENLSRQTSGFSGADIEAVCNEASIIAMMAGKKAIDHACVEEAIDKKIFKGNRSKKEEYLEDKKIVAYHEAGHAVMNYLLGEPIARASIQSTVSGVGGVVFSEDKDSVFMTNKDFENRILICYAGRASEEIKYDHVVTTGASNDITQATKAMTQYIEHYGFDKEFGMLDVSVLSAEHLVDSGEITKKLSKMSRDLYIKCLDMLKENYRLVEAIAEALLEEETLSGEQITSIIKTHQ